MVGFTPEQDGTETFAETPTVYEIRVDVLFRLLHVHVHDFQDASLKNVCTVIDVPSYGATRLVSVALPSALSRGSPGAFIT